MLMPCTLKHCLLIRAPKWFAFSFNAVKMLVLDPVTQEKVQIVSGDKPSLELLRRYMRDDVIPAYLGGELRTNGDPECKLLLGNSSGSVPPEAVSRFHQLLE